ncbi:hypothetical protein ACP6PL_27370 [Dapis sp. BLCC M126]|uniref:hypothetical protein n=1 Tax=Dapis sp. BLCC M126 TaxID=3400189 RepID=UPI003CE6CD12
MREPAFCEATKKIGKDLPIASEKNSWYNFTRRGCSHLHMTIYSTKNIFVD